MTCLPVMPYLANKTFGRNLEKYLYGNKRLILLSCCLRACDFIKNGFHLISNFQHFYKFL